MASRAPSFAIVPRAPSSAMVPRAPSSAMVSRAPAPPWPPELPAPPRPSSSLHHHGFQSSQLRHGPCLSVLLWRSPSCVPVCVCPEGPPERPPPPLLMELLRLGTSLSGGGSYVSPLSCVSCVSTSCFLIWFVSCPCLMSLLVHSCPAVFV